MSDRPTAEASFLEQALQFHAGERPGKIEIIASKPMATQRDLSLAYSPGVAAPVRAIYRDPLCAYEYTAKGNLVAVISNGTAILGLGNLGALASKPVMEGKAVLFKRFAEIDAIDLEIDETDIDDFIQTVKRLEPTFGGINLEDIRSPDCFVIEARLRDEMQIPVFHDDQHGTAIIAAAGLINACYLTDRQLGSLKVVVCGAGAAGLSVAALVKAMGVAAENCLLVDNLGVVYHGRAVGMDQFKSAHAVDTPRRTLAEAMRGADCLLGLSAANIITREMVATMADRPIIFAMANPDPEITPEEVKAERPDAIIATGRSDYPNQVNNVLGFPYIFRGALDVRATTINEEMKVAAVRALAELAREAVPDEVIAAYGGARKKFGPEYIIPAPFDPRLIERVPMAVANAAIASGVARRSIASQDAYRIALRSRLNPTSAVLAGSFEAARARSARVVFAEGEQEIVLRAALELKEGGYGRPVLVGRERPIKEALRDVGANDVDAFEIHNSSNSPYVPAMVERLYQRLQRRGYLRRDVQRLVNNERNIFAALLLDLGHVDVMVSGVTRHFGQVMGQVDLVIDQNGTHTPFGMHMFVGRSRTIFIADTAVNESPDASMLADIARQAAAIVRNLGQEPRVAFLSYSNFGNPPGRGATDSTRMAVALLDASGADFEYEGEISADVALNWEMIALYPFSRLSAPANILIMPGLHVANVSAKLLKELGNGRMIGPLLVGMAKPVQIVPMTAGASDLVTTAVLAASGVV